MVKRKRYRFRQGDVIDVEEFHDGRYGGPGTGRAKRAKPTEEQMRRSMLRTKPRGADRECWSISDRETSLRHGPMK